MRKKNGFTLIELMIVITIIGILVAVIIPMLMGGNGCRDVNNEDAISAAETFGFSDVRIVERHKWNVRRHGCGSDDAFAFEAVGMNAADKKVNFIICCGRYGKACTVRSR